VGVHDFLTASFIEKRSAIFERSLLSGMEKILCARLEWVLRLAALAFPMAQDAVDDAGIGNKGDDAHAGAASQRVSLENFPDQTGPSAAGLPGEIGIVPGRGAGAPAGGLSACVPAQTILPRLE
jgi:hypothetical protein